jgi:hypothetical protein
MALLARRAKAKPRHRRSNEACNPTYKYGNGHPFSVTSHAKIARSNCKTAMTAKMTTASRA